MVNSEHKSDSVNLAFSLRKETVNGRLKKLVDRQITHLICVRLRHLLYDFFMACFGPVI